MLLHVQGTKSEAARWTKTGPDQTRPAPDTQAITKPAFLLRAKAVDSLRLAVCTVLYLRLLLAFSPALSLVLSPSPFFRVSFLPSNQSQKTPRADFPKAARTTQTHHSLRRIVSAPPSSVPPSAIAARARDCQRGIGKIPTSFVCVDASPDLLAVAHHRHVIIVAKPGRRDYHSLE